MVVVGDRESDIYSCFARRAAGVDLIVRAAQDRLTAGAQQGPAGDASLFTSPAAWPELTQMLVKVAPRRVGDPVGSPRSPCEPARLSSSGRVMALPKPTRRRWR